MGEGGSAGDAPDAFEQLLDVVLQEVPVDLLVSGCLLLHFVHLNTVEHQRVLLKLPLRPSGPVVRKIHQVPVGRDTAGQAVLGRDWAGLRMCQGVRGVGRYNKRVKILKHKNVLICLSDRSSSTLCRFLRRSSFKSSRNLYISQYCTVV